MSEANSNINASELSLHRKIRLWREDLPEAYCGVDDKHEDLIACHSPANLWVSSRIVVMEAIIPRGARYLYGLLGARYNSQKGPTLLIRIGTCAAPASRFNDSLIAALEQAYVGLPSEYMKSVIEGAKTAQEIGNVLGPGTLEFCYAAHGLVSSSSLIYSKLSSAIVKLLGDPSKSISKEQLENMMR